MKSIKARKQRKSFFNAPLHKRQNNISSHLEENLLMKYDRRSVPLITGDTVKVMRGIYKGHESKVATIHVKKYRVEVEGVTITKADGKKIAKPVHPSNLLITKLNLTDKWRRNNLEKKVSAETKKDIEAEGKQQLIELEKERKQEEARLAAEKKAEKEEDEEVVEEEDIKEEPTVVDKKIDSKIKTEDSPELDDASDSNKKKTPQTKNKSEGKKKKEDDKEETS
ncbi:MAG: 50S ribosomal protein L24 [Thermoplasmata archaeon]|nr:MAG: 50S ribosomal protein L24 [Thermoplasmata archaeon]